MLSSFQAPILGFDTMATVLAPTDKTPLRQLCDVGFEIAAVWAMNGTELEYCFTEVPDERLAAMFAVNNALYAFCSSEAVLYIGKTTRTLRKRLAGYCRPGSSQRTNLKCHEHIKADLANGNEIVLLAFAPANDQFFRGHEINLAAGLEDALIRRFSPAWNHAGKLAVSESAAAEAELSDEDLTVTPLNAPVSEAKRFTITLQPTYFRKGIVNPGLAVSHLFGKTGDLLTVGFSDGAPAITTRIDRTANKSGAVRLVGGNAAIADWFQSHFRPGEQVEALILGPHQIEFLASGG